MAEHPLRSVKTKGAGILPVCRLRGELFCLFQHEIRSHYRPPSEKCFTFLDFGGGPKPEEEVFTTAAREFLEEVQYEAAKLLTPYNNNDDGNTDVASLSKVLESSPYCVKGKNSYICFLLPVAFVPACLLGQRLAKLEYKKEKKKIQTFWWLPFSRMTERRLPIHSRLKIPGLSKAITKLGKKAELLSKDGSSAAFQSCLSDRSLMKDIIRRMVWESMDECSDVKFPRPCFGRIPNFAGSELAAMHLIKSEQFKEAKIVKINPSLAQEDLRYLTLKNGKHLMTPSPALEAFFMYMVEPETLRSDIDHRRAATKEGAMVLGRGLRVASWPQPSPHIDLLVVASVAVSPHSGARIGKGLGFGEMEWAILHDLGAISERTILATTVSESQLVYDLPEELLASHDMRVDLIATPERLIEVARQPGSRTARPRIDWTLLDESLINATPALREMRARAKARVSPEN